MARILHVTVAKVGENLFNGEAVSVTLPGREGVFEVLAGHEPFVTTLTEGSAKVVLDDGSSHVFPIIAGIAEISHNQATVLL